MRISLSETATAIGSMPLTRIVIFSQVEREPSAVCRGSFPSTIDRFQPGAKEAGAAEASGRHSSSPVSPLVRDVGGRLLPQRAAVGDAALAEVVRREGDGHDVARQDTDEMLAHPARDVGDDLVAVLQPDLELRVGQRGRHLALDLEGLFFCHRDPSTVEEDADRARFIHSGWGERLTPTPTPITSAEGSVCERTKTAPAFPGLRASEDKSEPHPTSKGRATGARHRWLVPAAVSAAAGTTAATAIAAPSAGAAARALLAGLGLVDGQGPASVLRAVEGGDGLVSPLGHLDEAEAARAPGVPVGHDLGTGDGAILREQLAQLIGGGLKGQVADVDVLAHENPLRAHRPAITKYTNAASPEQSRGGRQSLSGSKA